MLRMASIGAGLLVVLPVVAGCAYPRRSTSLTAAREDSQVTTAPSHLWRLELVGATIPPRRRGNLPWDEDDELPDPYVRIYRGGQLVHESPVVESSREPSFDHFLPNNLHVPPDQELRLEVWDQDDGASDDPIGIWRGNGLPPNALPDADARVLLENGAELVFRVHRPQPHRGVGIELYEVRSDALVVLEVIEHSPAGRAGIAPGDRVVAVGGRSVEDMGSARAASALSLAADRQETLTVEREGGQRDEVELDRGYVWLAM